MWGQLISLLGFAAFTTACLGRYQEVKGREGNDDVSVVKRDVHETLASLKTTVESFGHNFAGVVTKFVSFCYSYIF